MKAWFSFRDSQPLANATDVRLLAQGTGMTVAAATGFVVTVLELAAESDPAGSLSRVDPRVLSVLLDMPEPEIDRVLSCMRSLGLINHQCVTCDKLIFGQSRERGFRADWAEVRQYIFQRDDYTCAYCGERGGKLECDHIHPVSRGGTDTIDNLATSCFRCNRSKRSKTIAEWLGDPGHG